MSSCRNCCQLSSLSRSRTGTSALPVIQSNTGCSPVSWCRYVVSHTSTLQPVSISSSA
ncbi:Uncharacterised protein [Mycobacterium tuberculosis]|nr:Uncharacterised protein [Mycobacterium tuberculosis]